jgi:hypothetical protein
MVRTSNLELKRNQKNCTEKKKKPKNIDKGIPQSFGSKTSASTGCGVPSQL